MDYPAPHEIQKWLADLAAGQDIVVSLSTDIDTGVIAGNVYEFIDDHDAVQCVVATERSLANGLGAALAMMPASRASDEQDEELSEFYREVINVVSGLINNINPVHIRLVPGSDGHAEWPGYESAVYAVKVGSYGEGKIAFATA